jgi:hypothetical protein
VLVHMSIRAQEAVDFGNPDTRMIIAGAHPTKRIRATLEFTRVNIPV